MAEAAREYTARDFLHPRYVPDWLALLFLRAVAALPLPLIWMIGGVLGMLLYYLMSERRHIALTNIRACFPELAPAQQRQLVHATSVFLYRQRWPRRSRGGVRKSA